VRRSLLIGLVILVVALLVMALALVFGEDPSSPHVYDLFE
jgi:hypothetical protein